MIAVDTNVLLRYLLNDVTQGCSFPDSYTFDKAAQKLQGAKKS